MNSPNPTYNPKKLLHTPKGPTFGSSGVSIVDGVHAVDWKMDWTLHPYQKILLIIEGSGFLEEPNCSWPLRKGLLVYVPDNWKYRVSDKSGESLTLFILFFHPDVFGTHSDIAFEKRPLFFSKESFAQSSLERMRDIFYEQSAQLPGSQEILRGMAWRFLGEVVRARSRTLPYDVPLDPTHSNEARVQHFIAELHESFYHSISLETIAKRLVMSKRSLTGIFRSLTGTSVLQYVKKLRIDHAKRLLRDSKRSLITISFECGFENISNFYRTFKAATGKSPDEWRKKAKLEKSA